MADEFQLGSSGNWWDSSRNRFDSGPTPSTTTLNSTASFGWPTEMVDIKTAARSSLDSLSASGSSPMVFQDSQKLQPHEPSSNTAAGLLAADPSLQFMGLGLSSQAMDWNQPVFRDEKGESSSFRSMLQEGMSTNAANFPQDSGVTSTHQWRHKIYSANSDDSSVNDYKQINRAAFSLDQQQQQQQQQQQHYALSPNESAATAAFGNHHQAMLQGLLAPDNASQQQVQATNFDNRAVNNYSYPSSYGGLNPGDQLMPNWSKFPQFLRGSPPKQQQSHGQLQFSNSTPFWNATAAAMNDVRSSFFPSLQTQIPTPPFEDKQKTTSEGREIGTTVKKSSSETSNKRPRNESPSSAMPAFKVRKEKMGDRITALQQLVSPFGKTDTASVLSEVIEYIKFLHEQVNVLSIPYMKSGASMQHQQHSDKSKDPEGPKQDLRSRGLCLVPVSSTFPVTHETTVDFWTPTFGGTFR